MRKPNESLDDYVVKALPETTEPPYPVSLRFTGEVEVLKPLARWERPAKLVPAAIATVPHSLSWFHRSLVMGGGFALGALVLASAIVIGVSDTSRERESAQIEFVEVIDGVESNREAISTPEEPLSSDIFSISEPGAVETATFRKRAHRTSRVAASRSAAPVRVRKAIKRRVKLPHGSLVSKFVPTTLVIFIEDGLIKSRLEPWLADRK